MTWKDALQESNELVLATSSQDGAPNANLVISNGFIGNKLLVSDCMMKTTIKNLQENNRICVFAKYKKEYYRVKGHVKIYSSGKVFGEAVKRSGPDYPVKHAILISIEEVFDLDKAKRILCFL